MDLTDSQKETLRRIYFAKGDVFEAFMVDGLIARGIDENEAREAARQCSNRVWRNSMASGAFAAVVLGSLYTPFVGAIAGSSLAGIVGFQTLLHSEACSQVRDGDLQSAIRKMNAGL
jgi:hypothetical protein